VDASGVLLDITEDLRLFLPPRLRDSGRAQAPVDGVSSLGHLVESAGVPLPEVGGLVVDGRAEPVSYRPRGGETVVVRPVARPQSVPGGPARFLLDVHLGALARRMRLVGLDTAYHNDRDDPALVEQANAERRVLLTQDRGLLRRRNLWLGAYVRGTRADGQLADVLDRFELPELRPWTRCPSCNGELSDVAKDEIAHELPPGTREAYDLFAKCAHCGRLYWHGAHGGRLDAIVQEAVRVSARR
jgi:uncharacterized protein